MPDILFNELTAVSLSSEPGVQISKEIHQLQLRISLWIPFMPPVAVAASAGFQVLVGKSVGGSPRHNPTLCRKALEQQKPGFVLFLYFAIPVLWMSFLLCYTLTNCVIGKCAPPPETHFTLSKKNNKIKAWKDGAMRFCLHKISFLKSRAESWPGLLCWGLEAHGARLYTYHCTPHELVFRTLLLNTKVWSVVKLLKAFEWTQIHPKMKHTKIL